ncbi:hypothetical protein SAMN04488109_5765 [Chryseolinea serpens]|uniref:Outer membrane protein beta-barrel domain-containing protein n=1 Tax=Chryseolinea serpens TaxID=947013 RepID=A0A1M5WJP5_9BACT|nr:hypothetical protein [Chryseolinea serpens]SHH87766.1 hypothetical protein SAMN04488109_5765 [Chryseolinea serpens]
MKKIMLAASLILMGTVAFAQWGDEEMSEKPPLRERIFTGGGFGLSFSSYYSYVSISPLIGVKITPKLAAGAQVQYRYTKYKQTSYNISTNDYGISPFLRYNFYGPLFLHTEYEYLNYEYPISQSETVRRGFNSFMAGGGLFQPIGRHAGFYLVALYNFSYHEPTNPNDFSPYSSPLVLRVGVTAGF